MNVSQLLEQRAERGTMIGSAALMNRIEADLQPRRFSLARPGIGFVAAAVVTLVLVGGILLAFRPTSDPVPPAETSTTVLETTTTAPETTAVDLAAWVGTYTWTEYDESIDPTVEQDLTSNDVLVHELHLTAVEGDVLTGYLTQNGSKIDRYLDVVARPSGEALEVYPAQDTGPYTAEHPLFSFSGDPSRPITTLGQLVTFGVDLPTDGAYFEPPEPPPLDQGEEAFANRQFVWNFQPGADDPEQLRTALKTYDGYADDLIRLIDEGTPAVREAVYEYLVRPSAWNVQTLALMQRYGRPGGTRENPEPWPNDIKWEIHTALQEASQATFGDNAELLVDLQLAVAEQEMDFCEEELDDCYLSSPWYRQGQAVLSVEVQTTGPLIQGTMRTVSDTGAGDEYEFAALPTDKGWQLVDGYRTKKPFVSIGEPAIVTSSDFDLGGYADPAAALTIAGDPVPIDPVTGSWVARVSENSTEPGWHTVLVTATLDGETNTDSIRVRHEPDAVGQFAFIKGLDTSGSQPALIVDYAEFLGGDEAVQAAIEDGELSPDQADEGLPNGFYIRNNNPQLRTLPLDDEALIYLFDYTITDEFDLDPVSIDTLIAAMQSDDQSAYYFSLDDYPVWLTIKDGTILQITPQYLP